MIIVKIYWRFHSCFFLLMMGCQIGSLVAHEFLVAPVVHKRQHIGRWRRAAAQGMAETIESAARTVSALGDMQSVLCRPACEYITKGRTSALMRVTSSERLAELCKQLRRVRHAMRQLEREVRKLTRMSEALYDGKREESEAQNEAEGIKHEDCDKKSECEGV